MDQPSNKGFRHRERETPLAAAAAVYSLASVTSTPPVRRLRMRSPPSLKLAKRWCYTLAGQPIDGSFA